MRIALFQAKHAAETGCRLKHGGGLMLLIGWRVHFAAAVLLLFIIPTRSFFTASERLSGSAGAMIQFLRNLAMMGGMLYIVVHAPEPLSLERK